MSGVLEAWQNLVNQGRFLDLLEQLERLNLKVTSQADGFDIQGPAHLVSQELHDLLGGCAEEFRVVLRISTLAEDQFGSTRLHHAVGKEDLAEARRQLANGARPNAENRFGQSPFHLAVGRGNLELIEALALAGADLGQADLDGRTPLHMAIEAANTKLVSFLLINGSPVNKGDFFGQTPLARAIAADHKDLAELLVEYDAQIQDPESPVMEQNFLQLVLRMLRGYSDALYAHSLRVADLGRCLARDLELEPDEIKTVRLGGLLHDLGKVSLPDGIFDQADEDVSDEDVELLMSHPQDGADALHKHLTPTRWPVHPVILHHHEKWDGSGFPDGLAGDEIPITAQLIGLADFYDHLVTHRSYDPAVTQDQALEILNEEAGHHFSDEVLDSLYRCKDLLAFYSP